MFLQLAFRGFLSRNMGMKMSGPRRVISGQNYQPASSNKTMLTIMLSYFALSLYAHVSVCGFTSTSRPILDVFPLRISCLTLAAGQ